MIQKVFTLLTILLFAVLFIYGVAHTVTPPTELVEYFAKMGVRETGAENLVTSIYLGYRAFDTLGETVVLLISVSGIVYLIGGRKNEE